MRRSFWSRQAEYSEIPSGAYRLHAEVNTAGTNEYCVLFAHAQDTLMTINTKSISQAMMDIFRHYDEESDSWKLS